MWFQRVNPIIRGKVNYYLIIHKAIEANKQHGQKSRCFIKHIGRYLHDIDAYTRKRLRVAMIHKNPSQRKGYLMSNKWNNEFFARAGLVPGNWYFYDRMWGYDIEVYIQRIIERSQKKNKQARRPYTKSRLIKLKAAHAYRS